MGNAISKFEQRIQNINVIHGLLIPVGLSTLLASVLWLVDPTFFQSGTFARNAYIGVVTIVLLSAILQVVLRKKTSITRLAIMYVGYHIGLTLLAVFVVPYPSPFAFLWIVLLVAVDVLFGAMWQRVSMVYYGAVYVAIFIHSGVEVTASNIVIALTYLAGTIVVALQVSKYRQVSDSERQLLDSTSKQTSFERHRLLSLINNMGDGVIATDEKGKILLYNGATLELLDTNETLEGKSISKILKLYDQKHKHADVLKILKKSPNGISSTSYKHHFNAKDAISLYLNITPIRLGFKEKTQSGYILIMRDITREKSLEEERDEFISVVSHELRTPVAIAEGNISNAIFMNTKEHVPKSSMESLNQAHDKILFLASMINDLATLSRAERTDKPIEFSDVDPQKVLDAIARDYAPQAHVKKLKFIVHTAPHLKKIYTSELYLGEILQNFVTNSIKYTKKGSIMVHVRSDPQGNAVFSVADTGIGLSTSDQKKIFEKFFRSEDYRTRESSGTGLGLYVTSKLAHRLKAVITVESQLNKGSTFTITVPSLKKEKK